MDRALQDKIPTFGGKAQKADVSLSGGMSSLMSGPSRSAFEIFIIALVAVIIIGGAEIVIRLLEVPRYIFPPPSAMAPR